MQKTYTFDGSTTCRGRNGWFQLHEMHLLTGPGLDDTPRAYVDLFSPVHGKNAPIQLTFHNPEELRQLICGLAKALHCMTNPEEDKA
jgi:hypothetical protein